MRFPKRWQPKTQQGADPYVLWPRFTAITELTLKWLSISAILGGAVWAVYQFRIGGAENWMVNMSITANVIKYQGDLRLLEVHVQLKNPRNAQADFGKDNTKYTLEVRRVPDDLKGGTEFKAEDGAAIAAIDLMPEDGYQFVPGSEFNDMAVVVLPKGTVVALTATWASANDEVVVEKIVKVEP